MTETGQATGLIVEDTGTASLVRLDDGQLNVLAEDRLVALRGIIDAYEPGRALVLAGRPGVFTAGLDLKAYAGAKRERQVSLLHALAETILRLWIAPYPVVVAATGHAVAGGTLLAMAADHAVAADGPYRWGLTETAIGLPLPHFGIALARYNVRPDRVDRLLLAGRVVDPTTAVDVGFADELAPVEEVVDRAVARAADLAALPAEAFAEQKRRLRGAVVSEVRAGLAADIEELVSDRPA
jgi:enoyl-CoA hydratase